MIARGKNEARGARVFSPVSLFACAVAFAVILILNISAAGTLGLWKKSESLQVQEISAGNFSTTATWVSGAPSIAGLFPGQTREGLLEIGANSNAAHLRWKYTVDVAVTGTGSANIVSAVVADNCSSTTNIKGTISSNSYTPSNKPRVCVKFTLGNGAPNNIQGMNGLSAIVTVRGEQFR